jgi:DNA mismatch repair protein MutS
LPLFMPQSSGEAMPAEMVDASEHAELLSALDGIDPDSLSPREALELIYQLKSKRSAAT